SANATSTTSSAATAPASAPSWSESTCDAPPGGQRERKHHARSGALARHLRLHPGPRLGRPRKPAPTMKPKRKVGRPRKVIDYGAVEKLAMMQCTQQEIASWMGLSIDTLQRDA